MARKVQTPLQFAAPPTPRAGSRLQPRQGDRRASWRCWPSSRSSRSASSRSRRAPELSLADLRAEFASTLAILAAHIKEIDRKVLAGSDADMAEESPRERLFDVLMRRLEVLGAAQGGGALAAALGVAQSGPRAGAQRARGALAAMDADRRRHRRVRAARA